MFVRQFVRAQFTTENIAKQGVIINSNLRNSQLSEVNYPLIDLLSKHYRKYNLEQPIAEFRKVILPAKRIRHLDDHIELMTKRREVAAVINARDEYPDIDIVFDHYQVSAMKRRVASNVAPVYVSIPDHNEENIRCVLQRYLRTNGGSVVFKLFLNRYIVGKPNLLFLPLQLERNFNNAYLNRGSAFETQIQGVWTYCFNETYPSVLKIDIANVTPSRPYKIGDLQNSMPQGMILHERYNKIIHRNIFKVSQDEEYKFISQLESIRSMQEGQINKQDEETGVGEYKFEEEGEKKQDKKATTKKREFSLKKQVQKANQELKKEVAQSDAKKLK